VPDYLLHNDHRRYLFGEQASEDSDAVDSNLGNGVTFQQVNSASLTPELINDTPERHQWSASGPRSTAVRHRMGVEMELPLTMGFSNSSPAPQYHAILKAANFEETINTTPSPSTATYRPRTFRVSPLTIYQFIREVEQEQSRLRFVQDVQGTLEFTLSAGEEASMSFTGQGYFTENTNGDHFPRANFFDNSTGELTLDKDTNSFTTGTQNLADKDPVIPKEMTVTVTDSNSNSLTSFELGELTFDVGWSQDPIDTMTATEGKLQHFNTRGPSEGLTGAFDLLNGSTSDFNELLDAYKVAEQIKIEATLTDLRSSNTEKIDFLVPKAQLMTPEESENNNLLGYQFNFRATRDTSGSPDIGSNALEGDNDFQITYKVG